MITQKRKSLILIILISASLLTAGLFVRGLWVNHNWKIQVFGIAKLAGTAIASEDFQSGKYRIYVLSKNSDVEFTNKREGPFEIWHWPYYDNLESPDEYTARMYVEAYNSKMRYLYTKNKEESHKYVINKAIAVFDEKNGLQSHEKYDIPVRETAEEWIIYFEGKIKYPGNHALVTINKRTGEIKYLQGE